MACRTMLSKALRPTQLRQSMTPMVSARTYATPTSTSGTRPPVALFGVDGTYASALYTASAKQQSLESTSKALENLHSVFQKDTRLQNLIKAPTLSAEDKSQIVAELQKSVGVQDKGDTLKNFLATLSENNRLGVLDGVCEKFAVLMSAYRGEVELNITSAAPLDQRVVRQIETAIQRSSHVGQGKKLKVVPKVDASIRGGLIVEIGDRTIDLSVSAKMAKMNKMLSDAL